MCMASVLECRSVVTPEWSSVCYQGHSLRCWLCSRWRMLGRRVLCSVTSRGEMHRSVQAYRGLLGLGRAYFEGWRMKAKFHNDVARSLSLQDGTNIHGTSLLRSLIVAD